MQIRFKNEIKEEDKIDSESLVTILLKNRKIKNHKEFLSPPHPKDIYLNDFGFKREIKKTLKILKEIKKNNQTIVVYTDYDADGITGGAILWETLNLLGFKVMPYVPHRKKEGYGFSQIGIDAVKKLYNPALIISVDHGITAKEKIAYAKSIGIPVIVTDHHLKPDNMPECEAIFHTTELSGSGVAYFFAKMILETFASIVGVHHNAPLRKYFDTDYLALASIGTIADMVPLVGVSRSIAKHGLDAFDKITRVGLKHIIKESGIGGRKITPYEIGFIIAPRINAVGRLEHAIDALRLLCTKKSDLAHELACKVGQKNTERQDLVKEAVEEAEKKIKDHQSDGRSKIKNLNKIIVLFSETWHEGIIGLIASKIAEKYYRPTIVITQSDGFLKASARSIPNFHITEFLREQKKLLIDVGGHKGAAGFTMERDKLPDFIKTVEKSANKTLKDKDFEKVIEADFKIPISKINRQLVNSLEYLAPYGMGNPQPIFYSQGEVVAAKLFGKKEEHLKIYVKTNKISSFPLELVVFSKGSEYLKLSRGQTLNLVYKLEIDRWGGGERVRGRVEYMEY